MLQKKIKSNIQNWSEKYTSYVRYINDRKQICITSVFSSKLPPRRKNHLGGPWEAGRETQGETGNCLSYSSSAQNYFIIHF